MLPVKKTSKSRTRTRRSHHALKPVNYSICRKCGKAKLPHAMCDCGYVNSSFSINIAENE
jgi:large subunit ribosomal protein L32